MRVGLTAVASFCLLSDRSGAQDEPAVVSPTGAYRVEALGGYQWFDKSAALNGAPFIGMRVSRPIRQIFSAGLNLAFSRPGSKGEYFPLNRQIYFSDASHQNDTTLLFQANQRVTLGTYGVDAGVRFGGGDRRGLFGMPEVTASVGAGFYSVWLDPERTRGNNVRGGISYSFGGGIAIPAGTSTSIGLRIDDVILTNYYRSWLSLSDPLFSDDLFPNPAATAPPEETTVHNLRMTISFSFVPGAKAQ